MTKPQPICIHGISPLGDEQCDICRFEGLSGFKIPSTLLAEADARAVDQVAISDKLVERFALIRDQDVSGVSGTGVVAQGCRFANGWCAIHWLTPKTSVAFYPNIETLEEVHGHDGKTRVVFEDN